MSASRPAVILLSGGLDSAVVLAICKRDGFVPHALTIDYGQRHRVELDAARRIADHAGVARHVILKVDLTQWGGSALTSNLEIPANRNHDVMGQVIPVTYVPARNTIFLSLAMGWAETLGTGDIFIGAHAVDYSGYPDCRPEYFEAFTQMAEVGTKSGVEGTGRWQVHTPLLHMDKSTIIHTGHELGVRFEHTVSCYQPQSSSNGYVACGICDACIIRRDGFIAAGVPDPTPYAASKVVP